LQRELKRADGDKARALVRALMARLKSAHMRRHLNDYTTDMRSSVLELNRLLDTGLWLPETSPLEEQEVLRKMKCVGGDDPVECIGILRGHWDQNKPKVTKPPSDDDDDDVILPPTVPSDEAELRKIMHHLMLRARKSAVIETLDDVPESEHGFVLVCAFRRETDEPRRFFALSDKEGMQMIRILTAQ
jgi:hypothetical protein